MAARRFSTDGDQPGSPTRKSASAATSQAKMPQPSSIAGSPAGASAITPTRAGAHWGSRAWVRATDGRAHALACLRSSRPTIQRAAKLTRKVTAKRTRPVAMSSDCRLGVASL